jgi:hypothetical protein
MSTPAADEVPVQTVHELPGSSMGRAGAMVGFVIGLAGVAVYVAGTLSPSFYFRAPDSGASSAVSVFLGSVSQTSIASGLMLYGGPAVVTIACLVGLLARRTLPWAAAATAAAAVWLAQASGWMNSVNADIPGGYRLFGHPYGYHQMSIGALLAVVGGVVSCAASRPARGVERGTGHAAPRPARAPVARIGLGVAFVGGALFVAGTFLPYGGPSSAIKLPDVRYSLVQINVIGLGYWPLANRVLAGLALWVGPAIVIGSCVAGLIGRRYPAVWVSALAGGAFVWLLRIAGDTIVGYAAHPAPFPHLGFQLMGVGFVLVLVGSIVALFGLLLQASGAPLTAPVDRPDEPASNRAMDTTGQDGTT